jgi:hypothetical protein
MIQKLFGITPHIEVPSLATISLTIGLKIRIQGILAEVGISPQMEKSILSTKPKTQTTATLLKNYKQ